MFDLINVFKKKPLEESVNILPDEEHLEGMFNHSYGFMGGGYSAFFDDGQTYNITSAGTDNYHLFNARLISTYPEVVICLEEILRDLFVSSDPFKLYNPDGLEEINEYFNEWINQPVYTIKSHTLLVYNTIRQIYIDGQALIVKIPFEKLKGLAKLSNRRISLPKSKFENIFLMLDPVENYTLNQEETQVKIMGQTITVPKENIFKFDFGLFDAYGRKHGFLFYASKYANQLRELQDMLIPMRLRRSMSRRIFRVDVGDLPNAAIENHINTIKNQFVYKKRYDSENGKIISSNKSLGLVEDYYVAHRNGSGGVDVENISENGNINDDLDDITYFNKKLFQSMFIPTRRVFDQDYERDIIESRVDNDEIRFSSFLNRVRSVYNEIFTVLFREFLKDRKIKETGARIELNYVNWMEQEKVKQDLQSGLEMLDQIKPYIGTLFSLETALSKCFNLTLNDINDEKEQIKAEIDSQQYQHVFQALANNEEY